MPNTDELPYRRIVLDVRRRITTGELAVGDRVPSTRALVRDWGVAMATATKALATLRQEGWVRTIPGSGTVVSERPPPGPAPAGRRAEQPLSTASVVRAAIALADREGRTAVSMRRLAAELGIGPMSLYRYVPDKEELLRLMGDAAMGEVELPHPGPKGWRARLELLARQQWLAYRRHPWLATVALNSLTNPPAILSGMRTAEWTLASVSGLGLSERAVLNIALTLAGYIGGIAMSHALSVEAEHDTGISNHSRSLANYEQAIGMITPDRFPVLHAMSVDPEDLDEIFEFGLQRHLDGIAALIARHRRARG